MLTYAALFLIGLVAFTIEGALGFGSTVVAASVAAQLVPLELLLPAFVPVNMLLSAWIVVGSLPRVPWALLLRTVAPPLAVGTAVGMLGLRALLSSPAGTGHARALIALGFAAFVMVLALLQLRRRPSSTDAPLRPWVAVALLFVGGFIHGMYGTGGPMVVYVLRRRIVDKVAFRASLSVLWLSLNVGLVINYTTLGLFSSATLTWAGLFLATLAPAWWLGDRIHRRLDAAQFERVVWLGLLIAGAILAARTAMAW